MSPQKYYGTLWCNATMRLPNTELILYKYTHQQRIGIACEGDNGVTAKEKGRTNKYDELKQEMKRNSSH